MLKVNTNVSSFLNLMRAFAAFLVLIGHLRAFILVPYGNVEVSNIIIKFIYLISGFGHQAVMIFFVISGYLVGGEALSKYFNKEINTVYIKKYLIKRFSRIYIVLVPALIIGFTLDYLGVFIFHDLYSNFFHISSMNYNVLNRLSFDVFIGNLFSLQTILVPTFGSNGPLWSISNEIWYYIVFIMMIIVNKFKLINLMVITLLVFLFIFNSSILYYFLLWILGAITYLIKKNYVNQYLSLLLFLFSLILSKVSGSFFADLFIGLSFVVLINSLKEKKEIMFIGYLSKTKFIDTIAEFSYSTYLFHFPIITLIISFLYSLGYNCIQSQPTIIYLLTYFIIIIITYVLTYLFYLIFERNTHQLRIYLYNKFNV